MWPTSRSIREESVMSHDRQFEEEMTFEDDEFLERIGEDREKR